MQMKHNSKMHLGRISEEKKMVWVLFYLLKLATILFVVLYN